LFAGAGGLGIEALSRGAGFCLFVEIDSQAVAVLRKNLVGLFPDQQYEIKREDFCKTLERVFAAGRKFDVVLADPPYRQEFLDDFSVVWLEYPVLQPDGFLALEHSKKQTFPLPDNLLLWESRRYGDTVISYCRPKV